MAGRYDPIWRTLKDKGEVTLAIPIGLQKRIIKGVIRTKDEDTVYKFELSNSKRWAKISYESESARVKIKLEVHIQTKELTLEDL